MKYILMYLAAIVAANLSSTYFGSTASILNSFLFIGLDLTARDKLHEAWHKDKLVLKMGMLISAGSLLSYALNKNSGMIAIASMGAFSCAAIVDTIIYHLLHNRTFLVRVNVSNIGSALIDSIVFPTIAFGGFLPLVTLGQFIAKIVGGAIWALIIKNDQT